MAGLVDMLANVYPAGVPRSARSVPVGVRALDVRTVVTLASLPP